MARKNRNGFTLIELVMILVLIGIIAVFVAPKLGDVTSTKASALKDKLRADIRYAQNIAMTRNRRTRVYFNNTGPAPVTAPAKGYTVGIDSSGTGDCSSFALAADPAGGNLLVTLDVGRYAGITVAPSPACLEYDSLGRPYTCGGGVCSAASLLTAMTAEVNNDATMRVTVNIQTGAVN
jgi:MSHA pilin protein MshC